MSIIEAQHKALTEKGFRIVSHNYAKPWGGYLVIDEEQAQAFANAFFEGIDVNSLKIGGKLSPKILVVEPQCRLSWQYHHRRAEIWRVIEGEVGIMRSDNDEEGELVTYTTGQQVKLNQGERHRLVGLTIPGVVAEIWIHTDAGHPSDEEDIVRVQDDYGR